MEALTIPKFENETDEANWLYENRDALSAAFHEAVQQGRVRQGTLKQRGITTLAERRGLRYQTYLKMLIHEALEREERLAS
jgi:predicted DNA binding CopG/RHH family protein